MGAAVTYVVTAGNAAAQATDGARLTLTGAGVVFEGFAGAGTCTVCPPGGDTWTVDLDTIPAHGQVVITVTARTLPTSGATVPVTATVHLTAALPDAEPEDNIRSLSHIVDGTPPTVTVIEPKDGGTIQPGRQQVIGVAQAGRGAPVALVEYSTDGATWQPAKGTTVWKASVNVPEQGTITFHVRATDGAGNLGPVTTATFTADGVPPVAAILPPEGVVGGEEYEIAGTAYDRSPWGGDLEDVEVRIDDRAWTPVDSLFRTDGGYGWRFNWSLPTGESRMVHIVRARAIDAAGNIGEPVSMEVTVDTVAPRTTIVYPADGSWLEPGTTQVIVWGWSEDDSGVAGVRVSLNGGFTWAEAMLAGDAHTLLERFLPAELPPMTEGDRWSLWAFAGTLPEDEPELLILARGTDRAGNTERPGDLVVVRRALVRYWLPLVMKEWLAPTPPTPTRMPLTATPTPSPTATSTPTPTASPTPTVTPTSTATPTPTPTVTPTTAPAVDVSGARLDVPERADVGDVVELRLTVPNRGTAGAQLEVRFALSEGVEPVEWSVSGGDVNYDAGSLYWAVEVPPQAEMEMQLRVRLSRRGIYRWQVEMRDGASGAYVREAITLVPFRLYLPVAGRGRGPL